MGAQGRARPAAPFRRPLWLFHRLRAMEPGEVQYRLGQVAASAVSRLRPTAAGGGAETARLPAGLLARWKEAASEGDRRRAGFIEQFPESVGALRDEADALRQGRLRLFGTREVKLDGQGAEARRRRQLWLNDPALAGVGDFRRLVWEVNRHQHWPRLALTGLLTGDSAYHSELVRQVDQWRVQNPSTRGVNWQSPMEAAIRAQNWLWTMRALAWSGRADDPVMRQLWAMLPDHVNFVSGHPSRYSSANNHLLVEAAALAILGSELPELPGAGELRRKGLEILVEELPRQVYPDGCSVEQAFRYHAFVLEQLLLLLAAGGTLPDEIITVTGRMAEFLADLVSDGDVPTVGDSDDGRVLRLTAAGMDDRELVALAGHLLARPDLARFGRWAESAYWITGARPSPADSTVAATSGRTWLTTTQYPDGGYTIIRSGDRRKRVLVDHGSLGLGRLAAHGHADCLSILMWLDGRPLLIDSGSYLYGAARYRDLFRSTRAHNTVVLNDRDQSEMLGPFLWGKKAAGQLLGSVFQDGIDLVEATHNGYVPRRHRRAVLRVGDDLVIVSDAISSPTPCVALASFYFAPTHKPIASGNQISVEDSNFPPTPGGQDGSFSPPLWEGQDDDSPPPLAKGQDANSPPPPGEGRAGGVKKARGGAVVVSPVLPSTGSFLLESVPVAAGFARLSTTRVLRCRVPVSGEAVFHTVFSFDGVPEIVLQSGWLHARRGGATVSVAMGRADDGVFAFQGESVFLSRGPDGGIDWMLGREVRDLKIHGKDARDRVIPMDPVAALP